MLDCLDDVVDDIRVFYRVDEPLDLPSSRFFAHAQRLHVRGGAVSALLRVPAQAEYETPPPWREMTAPLPPPGPVIAAGTADDIAAMAAMSQNPGFPSIGYAS